MPSVEEIPASNDPAKSGAQQQLILRRHGSETSCDVGPTGRDLVNAYEQSIITNKSNALLVWPQALQGVSVIHACASLSRLSECDTRRLTTIFFPWNRISGSAQRALLVDRQKLVAITRKPLDRIHLQRPQHPAFSYLLALLSLHHLDTGEPGNRRFRAVERDASLLHPTLFEVMPQRGIEAAESANETNQFLRRLKKHTWIKESDDHLASASAASTTPFYLFGIHAENSSPELLQRALLKISGSGRALDILLIDVGHRAKNALGDNWRETLSQFCKTLVQTFGSACPAALAVTDDVFALQALRWKILTEYDALRGALPTASAPASARMIVNVRTDILDATPTVPAWINEISIETYGSDLLDLTSDALQLRKSLLAAGESDLASAVADATWAIQNLAGLPGPVRPFLDFLVDNHEAYEVQRIGSRYEHLAPRNKIETAIKLGYAGSDHAKLFTFLKSYNRICIAIAADNPGTRFFDASLTRLANTSSKSLVVFASDLVRAFAEWRIQNEPAFENVRKAIGQSIRLTRARDVHEELEHARDIGAPFEEIVFIEPYADDFLKTMAETTLPGRIRVSCHLSRVQQVLKRIEALLEIDGVSPVEWNLLKVEEALKEAMAGHVAGLPDLDALGREPRINTIDLAGLRTASSGPTRMIRTSGYVCIRAFDGTELAVYEPDSLPVFSRRLAKDLKPGDQICAFSPEFIDDAREKLRLSATAPEVLALYHRAVAEAAAKLSGKNLDEKAESLRRLIEKADPSVALPQSIRPWIDVAGLLDVPRYQVRPQAPRNREHYFAFMRALAISDDVSKYYWDFGVFWTRSKRISTGSAFHQVFLGLLIDPHGTIARFPQADQQDIWRIHEMAQEHLVSVVTNEEEGLTE